MLLCLLQDLWLKFDPRELLEIENMINLLNSTFPIDANADENRHARGVGHDFTFLDS